MKKARLEAGYHSIDQVLKAFPWPAATYRAHELGHKSIRIALAIRYAKAFNVDPAWLIYGDHGLNRTTRPALGAANETIELIVPALVAAFEALNVSASPQALAEALLGAIVEASQTNPESGRTTLVAELTRAAVERSLTAVREPTQLKIDCK